MNIAVRFFLLIVVIISLYYLLYWMPLTLIFEEELDIIAKIISLICSLAAGWFVWSGTSTVNTTNGLGKTIVIGAIVTGAIGFSAGFFGPIIFMPSANQGPLIGILFTGPLGFLLGGIGGLIYWVMKNKKVSI